MIFVIADCYASNMHISFLINCFNVIMIFIKPPTDSNNDLTFFFSVCPRVRIIIRIQWTSDIFFPAHDCSKNIIKFQSFRYAVQRWVYLVYVYAMLISRFFSDDSMERRTTFVNKTNFTLKGRHLFYKSLWFLFWSPLTLVRKILHM